MQIRSLPTFDDWIRNLRDRVHRGRILDRIGRISEGNFGDHRGVGDGVMELRLAFGPGYRIYYVVRGEIVVVLLCGGDKSSQANDIKRAKELAKANAEKDDEEVR